MPTYAFDSPQTPSASGVVHLDSVYSMVFCANPSAKRSAVAHKRVSKSREVLVFFTVDGADGWIVALQGNVASLDLKDDNRFFIKGDYVGL
jgi:hypothetical protein